MYIFTRLTTSKAGQNFSTLFSASLFVRLFSGRFSGRFQYCSSVFPKMTKPIAGITETQKVTQNSFRHCSTLPCNRKVKLFSIYCSGTTWTQTCGGMRNLGFFMLLKQSLSRIHGFEPYAQGFYAFNPQITHPSTASSKEFEIIANYFSFSLKITRESLKMAK